ncbi:winged helix-turn-helix transcriptional regulator [Kribbella sp. NPDC055071]
MDEESNECQAPRARLVLSLVGDKWSLLVVRSLRNGPLRFTQLKREIDGISQRMLTVTLRGLERDGIVRRTVLAVMPPHVSYELTELGIELRKAAIPLLNWSVDHLDEIDAARTAFDLRSQQPAPQELR